MKTYFDILMEAITHYEQPRGYGDPRPVGSLPDHSVEDVKAERKRARKNVAAKRKAKKLRALAYTAIERATLSADPETAAKADEAFDKWRTHDLTDEELQRWAHEEIEYRQMRD